MDVKEQVALQLGKLVIANIELAAQVESLQTRIQTLTPKPEPEPYPDKTQGSMES